MEISKYLRFWERPMAKDVARLLSEVDALRQFQQQHADALSALHDRVDGVSTHLGDVAMAHLSVTEALRDRVDFRLELMSDAALATLGELAQLRAVQGNDGAGPSPNGLHAASDALAKDGAPDMLVTSDNDSLVLPPRDRHAMLILSSFFQNPVE